MIPTLTLLLSACGVGPEGPGAETPETPSPSVTLTPAPLPQRDPVELLARVSLDLRGVRPTVAEIARVESDPAALEDLVEEYLVDPRLEGRLLELFNEIVLSRSSTATYFYDYYAIPDYNGWVASIGEEPIRFLTWIALEDRPWSEVLTSDVTVLDENLAPILPTDYPQGTSGWQVVHYTDDRPDVGLLATTGLYVRYPSTASNKQRKRANQVSRILTCRDYLLTEVQFDANVDLTDEAALADAIKNNAGCKACHDTLDPLASYFWGWKTYYDDGFYLAGASTYHPETERAWMEETGTAPGWMGEPGDTLVDLSEQIRNDREFQSCIVKQVFTHLMRRPTMLDDTDELVLHESEFVAGGTTIRSLLRSVVADPRYRVADTLQADAVPKKWMTADVVRSSISDLTGFVWSTGGIELLRDDSVGLLTLSGGVDGKTSTVPALGPSPTAVLVLDRYAGAGALHAVQTEMELPLGERRLFPRVDLTSDADVGVGLEDLFVAVLGRRVDPAGAEVQALSDLWHEAEALSDPSTAWAAVLAALLRDPDYLIY